MGRSAPPVPFMVRMDLFDMRTVATPKFRSLTSVAAHAAIHAIGSGSERRTGARAARGASSDGELDLNGKRVLICEDEPMIGFDLALNVRDANGEPIGPFATVADAMEEIARQVPDAAMLDVNLIDGEVTPVLRRLISQGVPIVVNTGTRIPEEVGGENIPVFTKPTKPQVLIKAIL